MGGPNPRSRVQVSTNNANFDISVRQRDSQYGFRFTGTIEAAVADGLSAPTVSIRVNPGIEAHTHEYLQTGVTDSKFGVSMASGEARAALDRVAASDAMTLVGVHAHIGSQVFAVDSFAKAVAALALLGVLGVAVFLLLSRTRPLDVAAVPDHEPDAARGEVLFRQGDPGDSIFVVTAGTVLLLSFYYDPMYDYQLEKKAGRILFRGDRDAVREFLTSYRPSEFE